MPSPVRGTSARLSHQPTATLLIRISYLSSGLCSTAIFVYLSILVSVVISRSGHAVVNRRYPFAGAAFKHPLTQIRVRPQSLLGAIRQAPSARSLDLSRFVYIAICEYLVFQPTPAFAAVYLFSGPPILT